MCPAQAPSQGVDGGAPRAGIGAHSRNPALAPRDRPALRNRQGALGDERAEARLPEPGAYLGYAARPLRAAPCRAQHRDSQIASAYSASGAVPSPQAADTVLDLAAQLPARCPRGKNERAYALSSGALAKEDRGPARNRFLPPAKVNLAPCPPKLEERRRIAPDRGRKP